MENVIAKMLEDEIRKTLEEVAQTETGSEQAKLALSKLDRLHAERINELEAELKENQRLDASYAKLKDDDMKKAEFEQKVKQAELDMAMRQAELDQRIKQTELDYAMRQTELEQRVKQAEMDVEMKQAELEQKDAELKEARRGRWWRTALELLGIGAPLAASAYWMHRGLQFEEEGKVYTSRTGQWLSNHLRLFGKKG